MVVESLKWNYVREFLQDLLVQEKYKKITPPESLSESIYRPTNVAFFLGLDAVIKYDQIIEDEKYLPTYIEQLKRIFKKIANGEDIRLGIYSILGKIVSRKLSVDSDSQKEILRYIYDKYIVNGYFYFGCSSNYENEINCIGIRKDSFKFDNRIKDINTIVRKISNTPLFKNDEVTLTDDVSIALYSAFLAPNYIQSLMSNSLINNKKNDMECFYRRDVTKIKELLVNNLNRVTINSIDKTNIINSFIELYLEDVNFKPCIARVKRSTFNKNKLKDIDSILINKGDSLEYLIALILESRYSSFQIREDVLPESITTLSLPTYNEFLIGQNSFLVFTDKIEVNKEDLQINNLNLTNNAKVNSYGAVSFAIIGILLIIIGVLLNILIKIS